MFVASRESHFVCIHLSQYCGKAHALKKQVGREGAFTRKKIQVGAREREREKEKEGGRQRNRGREQVSEILPFICLSFTPLCSLVIW